MTKMKKCGVCKTNEAKYKCPTCFLPFCSVPCNRNHKQTPCSASPKPTPTFPPRAAPAPSPSEDDLLTTDQLANLDSDPEVSRKTADSRLLAAITRVDSAPDRAAALAKEMQDPAFVELCDDVLAALGVPRADAGQHGRE